MERLKTVLNNHTPQDCKPMQQAETVNVRVHFLSAGSTSIWEYSVQNRKRKNNAVSVPSCTMNKIRYCRKNNLYVGRR